MTQVATQQPTIGAPTLVLTPPEVVTPVTASQVPGAVKLDATEMARVDETLNAFLAGLLSENVSSDGFRTKLDSAFSLGRKEIAEATTMSNAFSKKNFVGETDTAAYKAIAEMRALFDDLNPAKQGDLFQAPKVLGIPIPTKVLGMSVPFTDKLKSYLHRYESADAQFAVLYENVSSAKGEVEKGVSELGLMRQKLWDGLTKLQKVVYFITKLDERLSAQIESMKLTDPDRARALEQEVLYYVRQNVGDVQSTQALTINAYNVCGELRKTGREVINGCDRLNTLGMAALSIAVSLAKATGLQMRTMAMLQGAKSTVEDLILATGKGLQDHVKATTDFASNPMIGVQLLQQMFDQTNDAMATLETFRSNALEVQKANNQMLGGLISQQMTRLSNDRKAAAVAEGIAL